jgi:uncharacterized protein YndB with AHSA1/START domain
MKTDISTSSSVPIDAPVDEVWRALTTSELIKQWFFGVDTETDWKQGSPIVHRGEWQGKPYIDKGEIVRIEPRHLLVHTHGAISPRSRIAPSTTRKSPGRSRSGTAAPS